MKRVLFLCTGNYYRSRFAEAVFNHLAPEGWSAFSRGLAIHMAAGDLASETIEGLRVRGIDRSGTAPTRVALTAEDLAAADVTIALHEPEHRPMLEQRFPDHVRQVVFWRVADVNELHHAAALPEIERQVLDLIAWIQLKASERVNS